jgi:2-phosphoglycerate kinase
LTDRRYRQPLPLGGEDGLPFSKGLMARALIAAGFSADRAYELALAVEADLAASDRQSISFERLDELAHKALGDEAGPGAMRRLRLYRELYELDQPIVLLDGGATGTGKSTVATDDAYRLGITRVTSTDFVRQTMRAFFSREFMPAIHHSSFEAGRAIAEADAEAHAGHFWIRDTDSEGMRAYEKYLDAFDDIRLVQAYILGRARKHDVPVVENGDIEDAIGNVMELVLTAAEPLKAGT